MILSSARRWSSIRWKRRARVAGGTPGASIVGVASVCKELLDGAAHGLGGGQVGVRELGREGDGRVGRRDERRRGIEELEALAGDEGEDVSGDAERARRLLQDQHAGRLRERREDGLTVERPDGAQV